MFAPLPEAKTYLPGPGVCIYCTPEAAGRVTLTREHIIARKLGGALVLHNASCTACAKIINKEIETPFLTFILLNARTHLGLPTSRPRTTLPWTAQVGPEVPEGLPKELSGFDFQEALPEDYYAKIMMPILSAPGILSDKALTEQFIMTGVCSYTEPGSSPPPGRTLQVLPMNPAITCRAIAKIAHGAAVAEFGFDTFEAFLPDVIMGRTKFISHFVGSSKRKGRRRSHLHRIWFDLFGGLLIANVQIFARYGIRPYQAIVGRPKPEFPIWHMSSLRTVPTPRQ